MARPSVVVPYHGEGFARAMADHDEKRAGAQAKKKARQFAGVGVSLEGNRRRCCVVRARAWVRGDRQGPGKLADDKINGC